MAGYSGTPLATKLGIRAGDVVAVLDEPDGFRRTLEPLPDSVTFRTSLRGKPDMVVGFFDSRRRFESRVETMARAIFADAAIWVCWPKKASKVPTDMTEDVVRDVILPMGLVDVKVCAVDEVWSGLKVVHRRENR